jgi:hypothetical protein
MTKKPGPDVLSLVVTANAEPRRGARLEVAAREPSKGRSAVLRSGERTFVAVEDVLFAGMGKRVLARVFTDGEINRLAAIFGLSPDEVAELYRPSDLTPAAAGAPRRRRGRSTPAG